MAKSGRKSVAASEPSRQREVPEPSERQKARIQKARERYDARGARLSLWIQHQVAGTKAKIGSPHNDVTGHQLHWVDAFGSCSMDFAGQMLGQLGAAVAVERGVMDSEATNAALAAIDGAEPKDEIEAMLLVQMVATQSVAMVMLNRAKFAETVPGMQEYGTLATKLLRTYAAQAEALAKIRRGGEQKVIVEHVHVYPGGQAIVGSITPGAGGGSIGNGQQPHGQAVTAALAYAPGAEMRSPQSGGEPVPVSSDEGETPLPAPRRRERKRSTGRSA